MLSLLFQLLKQPWLKKIMGFWNKGRAVFGKMAPLFNLLKPLMNRFRRIAI
jgi:hypothetical protein